MNPVALFAQMFGKSVPVLLVPSFTFHFFVRIAENGGDVAEALKYAAIKTLIPF